MISVINIIEIHVVYEIQKDLLIFQFTNHDGSQLFNFQLNVGALIKNFFPK